MELGYIIGWVGVAFGVLVPLPQLIKIFKTKSVNDISIWTYAFLCCALLCYLIHAIHIKAIVFIAAQSFNLTTNSIILQILIRNKMR